jgi:hypothetical protein
VFPVVHMVPPNILTSSAQTKRWLPFNIKPFRFSWSLQMAYSKAKLKSNAEKSPPCFKPSLIGNLLDKFLPTRNLLYVSVRHIFISLTSIVRITISMRILCKTSPLT